MVEGLSHITFVVEDLDGMTDILTTLLGFQEVYSSGEQTFSKSPEKFFIKGDLWIAIMQGAPLTHRSYNHVAFKVSEDELEEAATKINALGLEMLPPRPRVQGEGQSIYFYDRDNHLFELHTGTLDQRLARYALAR